MSDIQTGIKDKLATKEQLEKRNEFLSKRKQEIEALEQYIADSEKHNARLNRTYYLKSLAALTGMIAPYVIAAGLSYKLDSAFGGTPFEKYKYKEYASITIEADNRGNISKERKFPAEIDQDMLSYYTKWEPEEDGTYSRTTKYYEINELPIEVINNLLSMNNSQIEETLGKPYKIKQTIRDDITQEELDADELIKIYLYEKDYNDYVIKEEGSAENVVDTLYYIILVFVSSMLIVSFQVSGKPFNYSEYKRKLIRIFNNNYINLEDATGDLELKKSNYSRLMR